MSTATLKPVGRRTITYGPAWTPPRPARRRAPRAFRHLPARAIAELTATLTRYRDRALTRAWHPKMRALLAALPPRVRLDVQRQAITAAAHSTDPARLIAVEDHRGHITIASTLDDP